MSFSWPPIDELTRAAVARQLDESISIYDNSGIFGEFERAFASYHGRRHALLFNSGTSALLALYFGAGLQPGDEVLCPAYCFAASYSPLHMLGARPVFCDTDEWGNLDVGRLGDAVTDRTRAVLVTHMWGLPVRHDELAKFCARHDLALLEDCSHAHGARDVTGRLSGTSGVGAAWSLQGQKTVSAGEGGILLTDSDEVFYRALLLGHYNKRCRAEIPDDHPLHRFALTGFGLKLRAHPLGIAIAMGLLERLDAILDGRARHAELLAERLRAAGFDVPATEGSRPSYYAFPFRLRDGESFDLHALDATVAPGCPEVDVPGAMRVQSAEQLPRDPALAFPWAAPARFLDTPVADAIAGRLMKVPVRHDDRDVQRTDDVASAIGRAAAGLREARRGD